MLTDEEITNGLSSTLRYDVVVLHKEKTKIAKGIIKRLKASDDFDYTIAVYAVQNGIFVGREQFQRYFTTVLNGFHVATLITFINF